MTKPSNVHRVRSWFSKSPGPAFQYVSDLHLEVGQQYTFFEIPPTAPYLILAGDIGRLIDYDSYLSFLAKQTAQFELVFLVLGNHEFYGLTLAAGLEQARKLEQEAVLNGKLILLHQKRVDIPNFDVTILGCTLWSQVHDEARDVVRTRVKDFEKIINWTVDNHNEAHKSDLAWLESQHSSIRQEKCSQGRNVIVVTHHAPSTRHTSSPKNVGNPWSSAFATELLFEDTSDWQSVKVWVFGHTHYTTEFKRCGIRVLSNQRGYVLPKIGGIDKPQSEAFDVKKAFHV